MKRFKKFVPPKDWCGGGKTTLETDLVSVTVWEISGEKTQFTEVNFKKGQKILKLEGNRSKDLSTESACFGAIPKRELFEVIKNLVENSRQEGAILGRNQLREDLASLLTKEW